MWETLLQIRIAMRLKEEPECSCWHRLVLRRRSRNGRYYLYFSKHYFIQNAHTDPNYALGLCETLLESRRKVSHHPWLYQWAKPKLSMGGCAFMNLCKSGLGNNGETMAKSVISYSSLLLAQPRLGRLGPFIPTLALPTASPAPWMERNSDPPPLEHRFAPEELSS